MYYVYTPYPQKESVLNRLVSAGDLALTTASAMGFNVPPESKALLTLVRAGKFVIAPETVQNPQRELCHLGLSAVCGALGALTGNKTTAARVELAGKLVANAIYR